MPDGKKKNKKIRAYLVFKTNHAVCETLIEPWNCSCHVRQCKGLWRTENMFHQL